MFYTIWSSGGRFQGYGHAHPYTFPMEQFSEAMLGVTGPAPPAILSTSPTLIVGAEKRDARKSSSTVFDQRRRTIPKMTAPSQSAPSGASKRESLQ